MENATKALIIAGAILISILIIALGVMIYNNASGTVDDADLTDTEIQAFNSKFTQYISDSMSATDVESLIKQVQATNESENASGTNRFVMITDAAGNDYGDPSSYVGSKTVATVPASSYYTATYSFSDSGLINSITVTEN